MIETSRPGRADTAKAPIWNSGPRRVVSWMAMASLGLGAALWLVAFVLGEIGGDEDAGWLFVVGFAGMICGLQGLFIRGEKRRFALVWTLVCASVLGDGAMVAARFFAGSHGGWDEAIALLVLAWAYLPVGTLAGRWRDLWLGFYLACWIAFLARLFAPIGPMPHSLPALNWLFGIGAGVPLAVMGWNNIGARALIGLIVIGIVVVGAVAPLVQLTGISEAASIDLSFMALIFVWMWFSVPARQRSLGLAGLFRIVFSWHSLLAVAIAMACAAAVAAGVWFVGYRYLWASRQEALGLGVAYFGAVSALVWMFVLARMSRRQFADLNARREAVDRETILSSPVYSAELARRMAVRTEKDEADKASAISAMNRAEMERMERMLRERKP